MITEETIAELLRLHTEVAQRFGDCDAWHPDTATECYQHVDARYQEARRAFQLEAYEQVRPLLDALAAAEAERMEIDAENGRLRQLLGLGETQNDALQRACNAAEAERDRLREALAACVGWLEARPDYDEGDAATACMGRAALARAAQQGEAP